MATEKRTTTGRITFRNLPGEPRKLEGLAARYNSLSGDLGGFRERIAPGAFRSVLGGDVRCLLNHDPNVVLGRTKSGTLSLRDTSEGLAFVCDLPETSAASDLHASVSRGDIDQCSFAFAVGRDEWDEATDENGVRFARRTILSFSDLMDVSVVTYPAYADTSAAARTLVPQNVLIEARKHAPRFTAASPRRVDNFRARMRKRFEDSMAFTIAQDKRLAELEKAGATHAALPNTPKPGTDEFRRAQAKRVGAEIEADKRRDYNTRVEADRRKPFQFE
jgi:HK97 family phage prohead protease